MTLAEIANEIKEFTAARDWKNDDPNQLLVALNIELGELAEHFMWKKGFAENYSNDDKKMLAYEMVDILIYLLQIANKCGIDDLGEHYQNKIKRLGEKYPVGMKDGEWHARHEEYKQTGKNKLYT